MWSLTASAGHNASLLGVGHFTVPPDVIRDNRSGAEPAPTVRNIIVPHDIVAVPRRSPIKARKRTPWHPEQAPIVVERGGREWLIDRVFVESRQAHLPAAFGTSAMVHVIVVIVVLLLLVAATTARADLTPRRVTNVSLRVPAILLLPPNDAVPPPAKKHVEAPARPAAPPPAPPLASTIEAQAAPPLEVPSGVAPEPAMLDVAPIDGGVAGGEVGGVAGGVAGGTGAGNAVEPANPPAATGPFRVGDGIDRPRKIKDVRPVYPLPALSARVGGNILIEATIGADGKVHNARVVKSIAVLDDAALTAVRQWEFEPSRLNGVPVAVTMVIVVTFSLL